MRPAARVVAIAAAAGFGVNAVVCWLLARRPWPMNAPLTLALPQPVAGEPVGLWQVTSSSCFGRQRFTLAVRREIAEDLDATRRAAVRARHDADPADVVPWWSSVRLGALPGSPAGAPRPEFFLHVEEASGWPLPAGRTIETWRQDGPGQSSAAVVSGLEIGPARAAQGWGRRLLPVRPLIVGTVANTACYGGALGLLWLAMTGRLRRWWRRRRGRCERCAYDLRGSADRCPECGAPV